jgi:hypothetical protein
VELHEGDRQDLAEVKVSPRSAAATGTQAPSPAGGSLRAHLCPLLVVCLVAAAVAGFYFLLYPAKGYPMPIGWDTPRYLDQTNIVAVHGLSGVPARLPPPGKTLASRAAFPVIVLSLSSLFTASTFKLAQTVPLAAATATALAAAAFVSACLRRREWEFAAVALVIGLSPQLIRLVAPETYTDNLFLTALAFAALVPTLFAVRDGRGSLAAVLLLGAGALAHLLFFGALMAVLALVAAAYLPASWRARRVERTGAWDTPAGRLGLVVGGAAGMAAVGMFGLLRKAPDTPFLSPGELDKKLREDIPLYLYPVTAPLAALGAAFVGLAAGLGPRPPKRSSPGVASPGATDRFGARFLLTVLGAWVAVVLAGLALFGIFGANVPPHRFLAMLLPLPILAALGILGLARWVSSLEGAARRSLSRRAAAAVIVAGLGGLAILGYRDYYVTLPSKRGVEWIEFHKIEETTNAVAYLDAMGIPSDRPVVFVVDDFGVNPLSDIPEKAYIVRSALPADRLEHSWFYVGSPDNYLARRPTHRDRPRTYNVNSDSFWNPLRTLLASSPRPPVALLLNSLTSFYGQELSRHPGWEAAPGVIVLQGPRPATPIPAGIPPWGLRTVPQGVFLSVGTILLLALIGLGWAVALLPAGVRSFELLALGPAFGIGFLLFAGVLVDAVGIRLTGLGGTSAVLLAGGTGWVLGLARLRRRGLPQLFPA